MKNHDVVAMVIHSHPDIRVFDMNSGVEAVEGRDGELASPHQGEEGTGEAGSYRDIECDLGIKFAKECLDKSQHKRFLLGAFRSGWGEVSGTIKCSLNLVIMHRPGLPV